MQKIDCGKYRISKLSKEDIASYFEKAYRHPAVKNMLNTSLTLEKTQSNFKYFGNILQAYVTATGDLSDDMIEKLADDFKNHSDKISQSVDENKLDGEQKYFAEYVMPYVVSHHAQRYKMKEPLSLADIALILQSIRINCKNNRFRTHSFNGALYEEIKNNGFDITKELFVEEYKILKEAGLYQPYQTGNLLFCELSKATLGYAQYTPERLHYSVGRDSEQKETETINDFYTRSLTETVVAKGFDKETQKKVMEVGKRIIDFYCKNDQQSVIAFYP